MLGGIHSDQRCKVCGSRFKDNRKNELLCPKHPDQQATRSRVYFKGVTKRFPSYAEASRFLTGLRFKEDEGSFDAREYKKGNPLGFETLALEWLELRKREVSADGISQNTYRALKEHIYKGIEIFGNKNVKEFKLKEFQIFLSRFNVSSKSKANYLQTLKQFFKWLMENEEIAHIPKFPKVRFELAWRKTIDKERQDEIIEEVRRISDLKTWLGIKWLATYFNLRPNECRDIKEGDIDLRLREILIRHPKENRMKVVYLLDEDIEILKSLPKAIDPELFLFRHKSGEQFGEKYFYKWWKRACKNLKIDGVDLYGGTRHSTVRALRKHRTPEEIRYASMHSTNKAFERYYRQEGDDLREIYRETTKERWQRIGKKNEPPIKR